MVATYSIQSINYSRVYFAVVISVIAHMLLVFIFVSRDDAPVYMDNGIQSFDRPRINLSISQMKPTKKVVPIAKKLKPPPVTLPAEDVKQVRIIEEKAIEEVVAEEDILVKEKLIVAVTEGDKNQEQIPIVENATFKGKRNPPIYPKRALLLRQEGVVLLKALIGINGTIKDIQIISSSGYAILDKSAIDALSQWKFEPSNINGKPSLSWVKVPVEFVIK